MKINDNKQRLKTYKIKNHDSGKTYSVKAVSYTDAKMKYNKYILKDAVIYGKWKDKDGVWNVNTNDLQKTKRELKEAGYKYISHDVNPKGMLYKYTVQFIEDSLTEDAYVYPTNASTSMALSFAKLCVEKFGGKVASRNGNKYVYVAPNRDIAEKAKRFLETEYSSITFIVKDSLTEDALTVGYSFTNPKDATLYTVVKFKANSKGLFNALLKTKSGKYCVTTDLRHTLQGTSFNTATQFGYDIESATERFHHSNAKDSLTEDADEMGYVFEVLSGAFYSYVFAKSAKEAKEEYERITGHKATSVEKRGGKISRTSSLAKNKCINVNDSITEDYVNKFFDDPNDFTYKGYIVLATYRYNASLRKNEIDKYAIMGPNGKHLFTAKTPEQAKRAIDFEIKNRMNDADIAQNDIKSTYLPEDANADNIRYLGFNEKRKLSFYSYGDRYFVYHDLEGRTEEIDKETVQKILKKNIFGEIDENDLINKEPQAEEIVTEKKQESGDR